MNSQDLNIKDGSFLLEELFNEFLTLNHMAKELYLISFVNFHHSLIYWLSIHEGSKSLAFRVLVHGTDPPIARSTVHRR